MEREGYRLFPRDRPDAGRRQRRRIDGARDQEHLAAAGADRDAIADYIKSLPPVEGPPRPKKPARSDQS